MDDMTKLIVDKLEKMDDKMDDIKGHVVRHGVKLEDHNNKLEEYNKQLEIHIRGVENLDARQNTLEAKVDPLAKEYHADKAVKEYKKKKFNKWAKILGVVATVVGIGASLYKFI